MGEYTMVGWFQKMFVGSVLATSAAAPINEKQTNQDADKIIQKIDSQLKEKKADKVRQSFTQNGLELASSELKSIDAVNQANTNLVILAHELAHAEFQKNSGKSDLPGNLLSPEDQLLLRMADEMNSFVKQAKYENKTPKEALKNFDENFSKSYLDKYSKDIYASNSFWNSATYRHARAQNMDIEQQSQISILKI